MKKLTFFMRVNVCGYMWKPGYLRSYPLTKWRVLLFIHKYTGITSTYLYFKHWKRKISCINLVGYKYSRWLLQRINFHTSIEKILNVIAVLTLKHSQWTLGTQGQCVHNQCSIASTIPETQTFCMTKVRFIHVGQKSKNNFFE